MLITSSRTCFVCGETLPETEIESNIPIQESGTPQYYISKIILFCSNDHPNECEVNRI